MNDMELTKQILKDPARVFKAVEAVLAISELEVQLQLGNLTEGQFIQAVRKALIKNCYDKI